MSYLTLVKTIEKTGCIGNSGERVYGTAAVLHWNRMMERPFSSISQQELEVGRAFIQRFLESA